MRRAATAWGGVAGVVLAVVGLLSAAAAQDLLGGRDVSDATSLEIGVDRPGADLFARSLPGGDVADCQQLCRQTDGCAAFTFDRVDGLQAPVCRIKDSAPPPVPASCCVSGVVGVSTAQGAPQTPRPMTPVATPPAAPSAAPLAMPPPQQLAPQTAPGALRDGVGRCLDLGADGLVRAAGCTGAPSQRVALQGGALTVGGRIVAPATAAAGCFVREAMTSTRRYVLQLCRAPQGPAVMSVEWRAGAVAIDAAIGPADSSGPGAALVAGGDPAALFARDAETGQMRLVGRDLCLVTPPEDRGPGAPVYLDYCAAPVAALDGARAGPDARARFDLIRLRATFAR